MYDQAKLDAPGSGRPEIGHAQRVDGDRAWRSVPRSGCGGPIVPAGLLELQRSAGNLAVGSLVRLLTTLDPVDHAVRPPMHRSAPAPTLRAPRPASAEPIVQRCGGEVHEGCSCAAETAEEGSEAPIQRCGGEVHEGCSCVNEEPPPVSETRDTSSRTAVAAGRPSDGGDRTVQRFTDGTPEAPSAELPDGSPYASMDGELLAMLGRTLTAKSFWRWRDGRPTNLGAAMDMLGAADVNTLVQLKRRCDLHGMWRNVTTMTGLWSTSSLGITFTGAGGLQGTVARSESFCRDTAVGESYHAGKACWREMVEPNTPGLHVCLPDEIHIDPHQSVDGKGWAWSWGSGGPEFTSACTYSFLAWLSHMNDVEGNRPVNPFTHHGQIRSEATSLIAQLEDRMRTHPDVSTQRDDLRALQAEMEALAPTLRRWSIQGKEGGNDEEARTVLNQLSAADGRLARARDALRGSSGPDPSIFYPP